MKRTPFGCCALAICLINVNSQELRGPSVKPRSLDLCPPGARPQGSTGPSEWIPDHIDVSEVLPHLTVCLPLRRPTSSSIRSPALSQPWDTSRETMSPPGAGIHLRCCWRWCRWRRRSGFRRPSGSCRFSASVSRFLGRIKGSLRKFITANN